MIRHRNIFFVALALGSAMTVIAACSDDNDNTGGPSGNADAGPDTSNPMDTSVAVDAADAADAADAPIDANYDASNQAVTCATTPCATQLTAGDNHFCARMSDGTLRCWGDPTQGELGEGKHDGGESGFGPVEVATLTTATQVSAAGASTCAVRADGHVFCWGNNSFGHLGFKPPADSTGVTDGDPHPAPTDVGLAATIVHVDLGSENVYAIANNGKVYGWGNNDYMQLAMEDYNFYAPRVLDLSSFPISNVGASFGVALGMTTDGQLVNWGRVLGRASTVDNAPAPVPLPALSDVTSFAIDGADDAHACAVSRGSLYCWGANTKGSLGLGVPDAVLFPTVAPLAFSTASAFPQQVAAAANSTCVRMTDGTIQCCGDNTLGALGQGTAGPLTTSFATASAFTGKAVQVVVSLETTCALAEDGSVMCWGGNSKGELGQGNNDLASHPTPAKVVFK